MLEHEAFSFKVDRRNLKQLYRANVEYVDEVSRYNTAENAIHIGQLKGAAFKSQKLSTGRLQGLGALTLSALTYANWSYLAMLVGPTVPMLTIAATAVYGALKFNYKNEISKIEFVEGGQHDGWLKITINENPSSSKTINVNPIHIRSLTAYGVDTQGASETNSFIVHIDQYVENGTLNLNEIIAIIPEEAYRDTASLDWILQYKHQDEETASLFNDLIRRELADKTSTGGIRGFAAWNLKSSGFRQISHDTARAWTQQTIEKTEASEILR